MKIKLPFIGTIGTADEFVNQMRPTGNPVDRIESKEYTSEIGDSGTIMLQGVLGEEDQMDLA